MEIAFSIILITLALVAYFSSRENLLNRWFAFYMAISSLGILKDVFLFQFIPWVQINRGDVIREEVYIGIYSVLTWISFSFITPVAFIMGLYFYGLNYSNPKLLFIIKAIICVLPLILSLFYPPISYSTYLQDDHVLWTIFKTYNLSLGIGIVASIFMGIFKEKSQTLKRNKAMLGAVVLPSTLYAQVTVFIIDPLNDQLPKPWLWNIIVITISAVVAFIMAFKNGFIGLKLSAQNYDWNSDMVLFGRGADYTSHMLKNQASKMEMCIEQLKNQYPHEEAPEELAILSRSISNLKNYVSRMKLHSQNILIYEESCNLSEMLADAIPVSLNGISLNVNVPNNVFWICDKRHITEVFSNVIINAVEAIRENGSIEITGSIEKSNYLLYISDTGIGMDEDELHNMFNPLFTTKSTERNFGLGLTYCKTVIKKHEGNISAQSMLGKGTTITIDFPLKRVAVNGSGTEGSHGKKS